MRKHTNIHPETVPAHTPDLEFIHTSRTTVGIVFKKHWTALPHDTGKWKKKTKENKKEEKKDTNLFFAII